MHGTLLTIPVLVVMSFCIPLAGRLSDRIGRRPVLWMGSGSAILLSVPAFLLLTHGAVWSTLAGLSLIAVPVTFYVSNLTSGLPALFPTRARYAAMGVSYNVAVALFGGTSPLIIESIVQSTRNDLAPAFYMMAMSVLGGVAVWFMRESSCRPLPGSMPAVDSPEQACHLVETQDDNPLLNLDALPFDTLAPGADMHR